MKKRILAIVLALTMIMSVFVAHSIIYAVNVVDVTFAVNSDEGLTLLEGTTPGGADSDYDYEMVVPFHNPAIDLVISENDLKSVRSWTTVTLKADGDEANWEQENPLTYDSEGAVAFTIPKNFAMTYGSYVVVEFTLEGEDISSKTTFKFYADENVEEDIDVSAKFELESDEALSAVKKEKNAYEITFNDISKEIDINIALKDADGKDTGFVPRKGDDTPSFWWEFNHINVTMTNLKTDKITENYIDKDIELGNTVEDRTLMTLPSTLIHNTRFDITLQLLKDEGAYVCREAKLVLYVNVICDHNYEVELTEYPTLANPGKVVYRCTKCGEHKYVAKDPLWSTITGKFTFNKFMGIASNIIRALKGTAEVTDLFGDVGFEITGTEFKDVVKSILAVIKNAVLTEAGQ